MSCEAMKNEDKVLSMLRQGRKVNIGVGLAMVLLILPSFFAPLLLPKEKVAQQKIQKQAKGPKKVSLARYWTSLPRRAVTAQSVKLFSDSKLSHQAGTLPAKTKLSLRKLQGKAFQLSNGKYVTADRQAVISDVVQSKASTKLTVYVNQTVNVLYSPYTTFNPEVLTQISAGQSLQVDKVAETHWEKYYEVCLDTGEKGWVVANAVSLKNPKIQQLQALLSQKYNKPNYSIYVKYLDSEFTAGVNPNKRFYAARFYIGRKNASMTAKSACLISFCTIATLINFTELISQLGRGICLRILTTRLTVYKM